MAVVVTPESPLGQELAKFEQHQTAYVGHGQRPGNPYCYRPFPKMLYRAVKKPNGKVVCMESAPPIHLYANANEYQMAVAQAEALQQECCKVVHSEDEMRIAEGQGWVAGGPPAALAAFEQREQALGNAAAEAAFAAQRMSEQARAEFQQAQNDTHEHVADVVPVKRRGGRPRKSLAANADAE